MCGITAIYSFNGPVSAAEAGHFTDALAHRGPDGRGVLVDHNVSLGHRRLSILDLSENGRCPMRYVAPSGRELHITFNGEVFNFLELRRELQAKGHAFASETDTEVIAAAYAEWGRDCQLRFNGMWAFAIFDPRSRELFVSRDRYGVKPCYAYLTPQRIAIASELKAFLALSSAPLSFNPAVVQPLWERSRYDGATHETAAREVLNIPGGHDVLVRGDGTVQIARWWDPAAHVIPVPERYEEQVEIFKELFFDAVRIRMRSDVPVATCLSGGVDSSAVAAAMHFLQSGSAGCGERVTRDWQNVFVATFKGTLLDEKRYADLVAERIGVVPHYVESRPEESLRLLVENVWCLDEPSGGMATPVWMVYRELRRAGVVVTLEGHGGDELLGGYFWHLHSSARSLGSDLSRELHQALLPSILKNFDRCSSAHGVEVRPPLLDHRLVSFAGGLPATSRIGGGFSKRILRDAVRGLVPEGVLNRQGKIGFNAPIIEWLNGPLGPFVERLLSHDAFLSLPGINTSEVRGVVIERCRARSWNPRDWDSAYKVSMLINLTVWRLLFIERERALLDSMLTESLAGASGAVPVPAGEPDFIPFVDSGKLVLRYRSPSPAGIPAVHAPFLIALGASQLSRSMECRVEIACGECAEETPMAIFKNVLPLGATPPADERDVVIQLVLKQLEPLSVERIEDACAWIVERGAQPPAGATDDQVEFFSTPEELVSIVEGLIKQLDDRGVAASDSGAQRHGDTTPLEPPPQ